MKARDLKQWQLFYNTNNYLCLVYEIKGGKAKIVNYNGTFYGANRDSEYDYSDEVPNVDVEEFFENFPRCKFEYYKDKGRLEYIENLYALRNQAPKLLLLC